MIPEMKHLRILITMLLCCSISILWAQDDEKDLLKENRNLRKRIERLQADSAKQDSRIALLTKEKEKADSLLNEEKKKNDAKAEKKNKLDAELQACADERAKQHKQDSTEIAALQQQIGSLNSELSDLSSFRQMWIAQLAESVDRDWLTKPYSKIDLAELEKAVGQCEEYSSSDEKIAGAYKKLVALLDEYYLYIEGQELVNSQYDREKISAMAPKINALLGKTQDPDKKDELSSLSWQLNYYRSTLRVFQDLIVDVDKQLKDESSHRAALPLANVVIEQAESNDGIVTAIRKIPWLSDQYDDYYKALQRDCIRPSEVHNLIMGIQP